MTKNGAAFIEQEYAQVAVLDAPYVGMHDLDRVVADDAQHDQQGAYS